MLPRRYRNTTQKSTNIAVLMIPSGRIFYSKPNMGNNNQPPKVAVISAVLGKGGGPAPNHVVQTMPVSYFFFNDDNFPPRIKAMTPKLQTKIVKMFAWQMVPNFDYYLWVEDRLQDLNT